MTEPLTHKYHFLISFTFRSFLSRLSRAEQELAVQASHRQHADVIQNVHGEWSAKLEELRQNMEEEKERAVASCLTSTLEEMSGALETEQRKRREQVRATREVRNFSTL